MRVAVTGASGFLGRETIATLVKRGNRLTAVGRALGNLPKNLVEKVTAFPSDYGFESLREAFAGVEAVLHFAARRVAEPSDGIAPFLDNVKVTENALRAAGESGVKKFILASSISVYSSFNRSPFSENENPVPQNFYALSKLICEHLGSLYSERNPLAVCSLRFATLFGWQNQIDPILMPSLFIRQALKKESLRVWGEGKGGRDLLYVKDAVDAIEKALDPRSPSGIFNVGGGRAYSYLEMAQTVNEIFDNRGNLVFDDSKKGDENFFYMGCARAKSILKWSPKWTLQTGLKDMKDSQDPPFDPR